MDYTFAREQVDAIEEVLKEDLMELGVHCACMIDLGGNIVASQDDGSIAQDIYSLAALAAGNFGAVSAMAEIIGEDEFSLLFHKGDKANIHFSKILSDFLLITIFGKETSLGFLRLKVAEAVRRIQRILKPARQG